MAEVLGGPAGARWLAASAGAVAALVVGPTAELWGPANCLSSCHSSRDTCALSLMRALGTMLGKMLAESGGTEQVARTLIDRFGDRNAHWAMVCIAFLVGLPLFFERKLVSKTLRTLLKAQEISKARNVSIGR